MPQQYRVLLIPILVGLVSQTVVGRNAQRRDGVVAHDQGSLVNMLQSSDGRERLNAVAEIRAMPASSRGRTLLEAVVREIERLHERPELDGTLLPGLPEGTNRGEAITDYYTGLLVTASQSNDPIVVPVLVGSVGRGSGRPIFEALSKFGSPAATLLLDRIERNVGDRAHAGDFMLALRVMIEGNPSLSPEWRSRAAGIARPGLTGVQLPSTVELSIDLAVTLRDPDLTSRVAAIAGARSANDVGLTMYGADIPGWPDSFPRVRAYAAGALERIRSGK